MSSKRICATQPDDDVESVSSAPADLDVSRPVLSRSTAVYVTPKFNRTDTRDADDDVNQRAPLRDADKKRIRSSRWLFTFNIGTKFRDELRHKLMVEEDDDLTDDMIHKHAVGMVRNYFNAFYEGKRRATYLCAGFEIAPTTSMEHFQGYVEFDGQFSLKTVRMYGAMGDFCHWTPARGSSADNRKYCVKEQADENDGSKWIELGKISEDQRKEVSGRREQDRWTTARRNATSGSWDLIDDHIFVSCYSSLKRIRQDFQPSLASLLPSELECYWLYGAPGQGKTTWVTEKFMDESRHLVDLYMSNATKWFDGYESQSAIFIDDVDLNFTLSGQRLTKVLCDVHPVRLETKGGSVLARPTRVFYSSNYSIEAVFAPRKSDGTRKLVEDLTQDEVFNIRAIKRRFRVMYFPDNREKGTFELEDNTLLKPFKLVQNDFNLSVEFMRRVSDALTDGAPVTVFGNNPI